MSIEVNPRDSFRNSQQGKGGMKVLFQQRIKSVLHILLLMAVAPLASAYIGPGSGISVIGSLLGLFATVLLTIGAIALFPFRRMMKKRRAEAQSAKDIEQDLNAQTEDPTLEPTESESGDTK